MKTVPYSSLAAFITHYRALASASSRTADEEQLLAEMSAALGTVPAEERAALDASAAAGPARRHRERGELHLRRALVARALLSD